MSGRDVILSRIRAALADVPAHEADVPVHEAGEPAHEAGEPAHEASEPAAPGSGSAATPSRSLVDLFVDRCGEYRATVARCDHDADAIRACLTAAAARHGVASLVAAPELDQRWLPDGIACRRDSPPLAIAELSETGAAVTACRLAIAATGTIVLDGAPDQGRRALTLVPDVHLCVVRAEQIVPDVADAIALLGSGGRGKRPITFISGPSATSDIELARVEGVHGPRQLEVVVTSP